MSDNSSNYKNNRNNRSSPLSQVLVVKKKKKFAFQKKDELPDNSQASANAKPEQKKPNSSPQTKIEKNDTNQDSSIHNSLNTGKANIQNLDKIFASSPAKKEDHHTSTDTQDATLNTEKKEIKKAKETKQNKTQTKKPNFQDPNKNKPTEIIFPELEKEKTVKKNTKDFLSEITIVSHAKDRKSNTPDEASAFLSRSRYSENNKKNKNFYDSAENEQERLRSIASIKRAREKAKRNNAFATDDNDVSKGKDIIIPETITVQELANRMAVRSADVVKELMKMGMMITASKPIDADTAELLVAEFGHNAKRISESDIENILEENTEITNDTPRFPVVSVMGHVDHGKTSLLDALRQTDIVASESGGITQHIGASVVKINKKQSVTFLDTPGHEAFTAMRLRGANATDMVILVVAADDGVKAQTIEAINHAKAANIPIIVAVNKIDKEGANPQRVMNELLEHNVIVESLGGECLCVEVSAMQKQNLNKLLDAILLQSELLELKTNIDCKATGIVIESKIDKAKGSISSVLVQAGILKTGDIIIAGTTYGKVRLMTNDKNLTVNKLHPSEPAEILGLSHAPDAGEKFHVVESEKIARNIAEYRIKKHRDIDAAKNNKKTLEEIFSNVTDEERKTLPVIIKSDVKGSAEAIVASLEKLSNDEVKIQIIHAAVGSITDSDISLAKSAGAVILGFNVRLNKAIDNSEAQEVEIKYFSIIYDLIDNIQALVNGLLKPIEKEIELGKGVIRQVFNISKSGKIAGSYVTNGIVKNSSRCRIIRDGIVIASSDIKALKHYKEDVSEVKNGSECGIALVDFSDFKEEDQLEFYEIVIQQAK